MSPITDLLDATGHADTCKCLACRKRDAMTPAELLARAQRAAALELTGKQYREARADVAADIVVTILARTAGTMPQRSDAAVSLTACCGLARTLRRSIDRKRAKDRAQAEAEADAQAQSADALAPADRLDAEADALANLPTARETLTLAQRAARRIGRPHDTPTIGLIYRSAREAHGLSGAAIAAELRELTATGPPTDKALDTRCARARKNLAEDMDAATFLRRLTDSLPRERWQWQTAESMPSTRDRTRYPVAQRIAPLWLDFCTADLSREASGRHSTLGGKLQRERAADWRVKPDTDAPVSTRRTRKRTPKLAQRTTAERTAARAALADAERSARKPAQRPAPKQGAKAGTRR